MTDARVSRRPGVASFDIVVRTRESLHPDGEPDRFVSEYSGIIVCTDDETGEESKVGKALALRVHAGLAQNAGESLFDVCDAHSHELHVLHTMLYEPDRYQFRQGVTDRFDAVEPDLLVLDYVVLNPKWRKLKLGLLAVRKLVDLIGGGCGLAVSLIAPLRHDAAKLLGVPREWLPKHENKEERREAMVTLRRYFRRMGFRRLGRSPYYALAMNQVTPNATELLGGTPPNS
jgi:hypothetical protein